MEFFDEGYSSVNSSPTREKINLAETIAKEIQVFNERYAVQKLIQNSSNGVIYKG